MSNTTCIQPCAKNPRYWQYKGKPVLLLGGTVEDNLHQIPNLQEHLDLLKSVGGNYIRNVMSCRDQGNVWPFTLVNGKYDLDQWNQEHWDRFQNLLELTKERDIFVQIEVWAFHDFNAGYGNNWQQNPWRPANNTNYTASSCTLKNESANLAKVAHPFFFTVPKLNNDRVVLAYQQRFVDKVLSYSLEYEHVLYCMTNEIHPNYSPEWGWYWSEYIKAKAKEAGKEAQTSEMYWQPDFHHEQHNGSYDHPEIYSYFESSQNSAKSGETNWENFMFARERLGKNPRPMNNTKLYGATGGPNWGGRNQEGIERFWRALFAGCASARFHRPPTGLGLSETAQAHLKSARALTDQMDVFACKPCKELLSDRPENGAYAFGNPGKEYAVYFPNGDAVKIDTTAINGKAEIRWLEIAQGRWSNPAPLDVGPKVPLSPAGKGNWVALIRVV